MKWGYWNLGGKLQHQAWMGAADNTHSELRKLEEVWGEHV